MSAATLADALRIIEMYEPKPTCIWCGEQLTAPLARLGATACLDCPATASYPMRFTHP